MQRIVNICEILKQRRKELKLTQNDLAALVGVTRETIVVWERGGNLPSLKYITALESALELPRGALYIFTSYSQDLSKNKKE